VITIVQVLIALSVALGAVNGGSSNAAPTGAHRVTVVTPYDTVPPHP
jgi:hypothetical protein